MSLNEAWDSGTIFFGVALIAVFLLFVVFPEKKEDFQRVDPPLFYRGQTPAVGRPAPPQPVDRLPKEPPPDIYDIERSASFICPLPRRNDYE